jgi:hypothetical protein
MTHEEALASKTAGQGEKVLLAYEASDGDEGCVIVFATNGATARRHAANEMNVDFEGVEFCRRVKGFDRFAPGPVPPRELVESGWWIECRGCQRQIKNDMVEGDFEDDDPARLVTVDSAVERGRDLFCCLGCMEKSDAAEAREKADHQRMIDDLCAELRRALPGAAIARCHAFGDWRGSYGGATVEFAFPGSHGASASICHDNGRDSRFLVERRDEPTFSAWASEINGGQQRMDDDGGPPRRES